MECNKPTTNYSSGNALLNHYDEDGDGMISMPEMMQAMADYNAGTITKEEFDFVEYTWKQLEGGINKVCPASSTSSLWLLIGAAIILLYLLGR